MQAQIKLSRIFGVEVGLHYSWFLIALLITLSLVAQFYATNSEWGTAVIWDSAIVTALLTLMEGKTSIVIVPPAGYGAKSWCDLCS